MRIAICLSGEMRTFDTEVVKSGLKVLEYLDADVFISTWKHKGISCASDEPGSKDILSVKSDDNLEDEIKSIYKNLKGLEIENFNDWVNSVPSQISELMRNNYSTNGNPVTSPPCLYKIKKANDLKRQYEIDNNFRYDIVIRDRPDNFHIEKFKIENLNPKTIYSLNCGTAFWPNRIYEAFFYGDSDSMDIVSNSYDRIMDLILHPHNNGLDFRDPCRLLFAQAFDYQIQTDTTDNLCCVVYRREVIDELENMINTFYKVNNIDKIWKYTP